MSQAQCNQVLTLAGKFPFCSSEKLASSSLLTFWSFFSASFINSLAVDAASLTPLYWQKYTSELLEPQGTKKLCGWINRNEREHTFLCSSESLVPPLIWSLPDSMIYSILMMLSWDHSLGFQLLGFPELTKLLPMMHSLSEWTDKKYRELGNQKFTGSVPTSTNRLI